MDGEAIQDVLGRAPLFVDLPRTHLADLAADSEVHAYRAGEILMQQGDPGDTLHVVIDGQVKVMVPADSGDVAVVTVLGPGEFLGELSLIDGGLRSATVEAIESVRTVSVSRAAFHGVMNAYPALTERLLLLVVARLRRTTRLASNLAFLDLRGLVAKRLLELALQTGQTTQDGVIEINPGLTQLDLAAMIGGSRESVNRQLSWFEQMGAIERRGGRIRLINAEILRRRIT